MKVPLQKSELYKPRAIRRRSLGARLPIFAGLFWLISRAVTPATGIFDADWSFPELGLKAADLNRRASSNDQPNAFIAGSSTTLHHVLPEVLDSATAGLTWYNWGFQRAVPPELFMLTDNLLDAFADDACEVLVVDVLPPEPLLPNETGALRHARTMDFPELVRRVRLLPWEEPSLQGFCRDQTRLLLATWFQHLVGFLRARHYLVEHPTYPDPAPTRGFVPLEPDDLETGRLRESREAFLAAADSLSAHNEAIARDFDYRLTLEDPMVNWDCVGQVRPVLAQMRALKTRCDARGIRCIFLFQKLWKGNGCVYFAALDEWGPCAVIETMGFADQPDLFDPADSYDDSHFMESGARKYSRHLARKLRETLSTCAP